MSSIAIITARGGSKRIPMKNIKEFCGKPIIAYSIEAALRSGVFNEVMVSTDSEEIAVIARQYGAEVPFIRSEETSNDFATTADVLAEVLEEYRKLGMEFDTICCIYPTAPFVTAEKLGDAMKAYKNSDCDSLMTVVKFGFPPQRALIIDNGRVRFQYPDNALKRSQDLEPIYHDCGQFYICDVAMFKAKHSLVTDRTMPFIVPEEEVQDIDNISDWLIAEAKYKVLTER
ncbi:pseudaminic acid cytidylyltransferase [Ruminococcus sp.]|uniref:pseudaminic acid cytidylyltransferase n=1 Tax=Ruminococcus sp. TaxID=41978 RepID=UPI0025F6F807|nr:pseudaminic acid cytidylyltransferase [Ruminococcus sp.]